MKVNELVDLTLDELKTKDIVLKQELFNLKFQLHTGRLENTARVQEVRKDIARVKTIMRAKQN